MYTRTFLRTSGLAYRLNSKSSCHIVNPSLLSFTAAKHLDNSGESTLDFLSHPICLALTSTRYRCWLTPETMGRGNGVVSVDVEVTVGAVARSYRGLK